MKRVLLALTVMMLIGVTALINIKIFLDTGQYIWKIFPRIRILFKLR